MPSLVSSSHHHHHHHHQRSRNTRHASSHARSVGNRIRLVLWVACIIALLPLYWSSIADSATSSAIHSSSSIETTITPPPKQFIEKASSFGSSLSIRPQWNHTIQKLHKSLFQNEHQPHPLILSPFIEDHPVATDLELERALVDIRQRQQRTPKLTNLKYFETNMVQEQIQLHDRYILQAQAFMRKWMDQSQKRWKYPRTSKNMETGSITTDHNSTTNHTQLQQQQQQLICVVVQTSHRVIPYIFSLLYSIISGHDQNPREWHRVFQTHLLHSEHRPARLPYTLFEQSLKHLPLWKQVHYAPNATDPDDYPKNIMRDTIYALQICERANLTWCLVLEDDAVVMPHLATVLPELLAQEQSWHNVSQISLFSYYNTIRLKHFARLENPHYAAQYERDVNPYNPHPTPFFLHPTQHPAGTVGNMYNGAYVPALIKYLQSWLHPAEASGNELPRNVDVYISNPELFLQHSHSQRWQATPSLVNHVGFYSERMENVHDLTSQLATDVRFRLEMEQSQSNDEG